MPTTARIESSLQDPIEAFKFSHPNASEPVVTILEGGGTEITITDPTNGCSCTVWKEPLHAQTS